MESARRLADALRDAGDGLILVVTGAGISSASGIPTFRGTEPGAIWRESDVSMATLAYFQRDPVRHWEWYLNRFRSVDGAQPNPAHRALVELETWQMDRGGGFQIVTQNIDTLHERAGSRNVIKVHGTSDRLRCARAGCVNGSPRGSLSRAEVDLGPFRDSPSLQTIPRCPVCDEILRAHVLFFDEYYQDHGDYRFGEVQRAAASARMTIFVGTSFSVGITELVVQAGRQRNRPGYSIDPHAEPLPEWMGIVQLREPAEELLPRTAAELRVS